MLHCYVAFMLRNVCLRLSVRVCNHMKVAGWFRGAPLAGPLISNQALSDTKPLILFSMLLPAIALGNARV